MEIRLNVKKIDQTHWAVLGPKGEEVGFILCDPTQLAEVAEVASEAQVLSMTASEAYMNKIVEIRMSETGENRILAEKAIVRTERGLELHNRIREERKQRREE
jgi:hypothetical protein